MRGFIFDSDTVESRNAISGMAVLVRAKPCRLQDL